MVKKENIKELYNIINDEEIDSLKFDIILPKLELIQKYIQLDLEEVIELIDALFELNEHNILSNINTDSINLLNKLIDKKDGFLDNETYYSLYLKHLFIPYNLNKCKNEYDLMCFLTEFENILNIISKKFNRNDFLLLNKINPELAQISLIYRQYAIIKKDNVIYNMVSHIIGIFYFKMDDYDKNFVVLKKIIHSVVDNYQNFINYINKEGILENFYSLDPNSEEIKKEYEISKKIIDYIFNQEEIKRKCK